MLFATVSIVLLLVLILAVYTTGEIRIHRAGGDVYNWTKRLDVILKRFSK